MNSHIFTQTVKHCTYYKRDYYNDSEYDKLHLGLKRNNNNNGRSGHGGRNDRDNNRDGREGREEDNFKNKNNKNKEFKNKSITNR